MACTGGKVLIGRSCGRAMHSRRLWKKNGLTFKKWIWTNFIFSQSSSDVHIWLMLYITGFECSFTIIFLVHVFLFSTWTIKVYYTCLILLGRLSLSFWKKSKFTNKSNNIKHLKMLLECPSKCRWVL